MLNDTVCKEEFVSLLNDELPNDEEGLLYGLGSPGFGSSVDNEIGVFVTVADVFCVARQPGGDGHIGPCRNDNIAAAAYQDHFVLILAPVMPFELLHKIAFDEQVPVDKRFDINNLQTPNPL